MTFDVETARLETPGCHKLIHFNNAGSSLPPKRVTDTMVAYLKQEPLTGGYELAADRHQELEQVYDALAAVIGASRDEIAVMENATQAWHMAFHSIEFEPGDVILTIDQEYASNAISYLQKANERGVVVKRIPTLESGDPDMDAFERMLDERVKLVAISHMPTNSGFVAPAVAIGERLRDHPAYYLLDACQSVGHYPVDVAAIGCDMLSATGRKYMRGPRGTGFLFVSQRVLQDLHPPFIDLHGATWNLSEGYTLRDDARRFENFETNMAAKLGLGVAARQITQWGISAIWERIGELATSLRSTLSGLNGITVRDFGSTQSGIVTFTHKSIPPAQLKEQLRAEGINVSYATRHSTLIDMEQRGLESVVRASVHYYNTEAEIERFCEVLEQIVS